MKKNTGTIIAIVALVIGVGMGYSFSGLSVPATRSASMAGMHIMSNGQVMENSESSDAPEMSMSDMMTSMNAQLEGKSGDSFDQAFLSEMIVHHQGAVGMAQLALANAKHQEIKDLASGIISAQNKEIAEMKMWQKDWYNQ